MPATTSWDAGLSSRQISLANDNIEAIGIVGIEISNSNIRPYKLYVDNNIIFLATDNVHTAALNSPATIYVLGY